MDPSIAVNYGLFVQAAYDMYDANPNNLNPPPSPSFPSGYNLYLTIQMKEYFLDWSQYLFYGFIAQSNANPNSYVVALRGTRTKEEWWLDFHWDLVKADFPGGAGRVASGFLDIFNTMTYMEPSGAGGQRPLREALNGAPQGADMIVTGHSLGSALITLYALEQAAVSTVIPTVYTFASPRVGDKTFKDQFNTNIASSYRVWNYWDLIPEWPKNLPWEDQYYHVKTSEQITSSDYVDPLNPACTHALNTYLYVLDQMDPNHSHHIKLDPGCKWLVKQ